jgi:DUF438 domain-containing protein
MENTMRLNNSLFTAGSVSADAAADEPASRAALLKDYVRRLSHGDSLASVRKDFVTHFQSVDAAEIAKAEQDLIQSGTPVRDVQKLCDVHSALFHGATQEERIANAEKAVQASSVKKEREIAMGLLSRIQGHPVGLFSAENAVITGRLHEIRADVASGAGEEVLQEKLQGLRTVLLAHYAKKGDLIYPLLKTKYDISGPADVMWGVDDEIRDELKVLAEAGTTLPQYMDRLEKLLTRAGEMVYKERNILLPICAQFFAEEDWMRMYYELPAYDDAVSGEHPVWNAAEEKCEELKNNRADRMNAVSGGESPIPLGSGHMTASQAEAVLNTIPIELSFIDDKDINCYFNAGKKLFKRPDTAIGREVYSCHPPKFAAMARQIIDDLRSGAKDSVDVWMNKGGEPVLVRYMAVRNKDGGFVGTLECVQKMGFARDHFEGSAAGKAKRKA